MASDFPLPVLGNPQGIEAYNQSCACSSLNPEVLAQVLETPPLGQAGLAALVRERCPYVFAAQPVFVSAYHAQRMARVVRAVHEVVNLPSYQAAALANAPAIARLPTGGSLGAALGYDFHLAPSGQLGLIEINTNAGGAMLNAVLARAQRVSCQEMDTLAPSLTQVGAFENAMVAMFQREWEICGSVGSLARPLQTIAIVDDQPEAQYLYPEFLLFAQLFQRQGWRAVLASPEELRWKEGRLWHSGSQGDLPIDLVYNRLTDFYLDQPKNQALRQAYEARAVVLTPHPRGHALLANKRQLAVFSSRERLAALGVSPATQDLLLAHVPVTQVVQAKDANALWAARRTLFFKPTTGFGSRAAYRGDKLTHRVWEDIVHGGVDYVAQAIVAPGQRQVIPPVAALKFDLRAYAYEGQVQWLAARLYQGQTTNLRTPQGGFAPVYTPTLIKTP